MMHAGAIQQQPRISGKFLSTATSLKTAALPLLRFIGCHLDSKSREQGEIWCLGRSCLFWGSGSVPCICRGMGERMDFHPTIWRNGRWRWWHKESVNKNMARVFSANIYHCADWLAGYLGHSCRKCNRQLGRKEGYFWTIADSGKTALCEGY